MAEIRLKGTGLCYCGCGARTNLYPQSYSRFGISKGDPYQYLLGHAGNRVGGPKMVAGNQLASRGGLDRYHVDPVTGCWEWDGAKCNQGYGSVSLDGVVQRAHRVFYQLYKGPIPEGLVIDHAVCQNKGCVNPDHLEAVTQQENVIRSWAIRRMERFVVSAVSGMEISGGNQATELQIAS